jgi:hypothetical protein
MTFARSLLLALAALAYTAGPARAGVASPPAAASSTPAPPEGHRGMALTPAVDMLQAGFGQSVTRTFSLYNGTPNEFAFRMDAQDVVVEHGRRTFVAAGRTPNGIAQSTVFSQRFGRIAPNQSATVTVRLTIPAETATRAVVIRFMNDVTAPVSPSHVGLAASLGGLITFNLSDALDVAAGDVAVAPPTATTALRVAVPLTNTGKEPAVVSGVAAIADAQGRIVAKVPFKTQRLLPLERLEYDAEYTGEFAPGTYRAVCSFRYADRDLSTTRAFTVR